MIILKVTFIKHFRMRSLTEPNSSHTTRSKPPRFLLCDILFMISTENGIFILFSQIVVLFFGSFSTFFSDDA